MGDEYRIQTYDFGRADLVGRLRARGFIVRETDAGFSVWETEEQIMPSVEVHVAEDEQMLVVYGGSPGFGERVLGFVLMSLAAVNDHVVHSEA